MHWAHSKRKARVAHRCEMCSRTIDPGETYHRTAGLDRGSAWTWKECEHCSLLATWVNGLYGADEYGIDLFHDWEPETIAHLRLKVLATRRRWRRADGSLYPVPAVTWRRDSYGFGFMADITPGGAS